VTKPACTGHLDVTEQTCEQHPSDPEMLMHLAAIGARAPSFNHDIASKIQGVMMAVDEITEIATTEDVRQAAETAQAALRELNQLLQQHRALTKAPAMTRTAIQELLGKAAQRAGVRLEGAPVTGEVEVAIPLVTQALSLAIDLAGGLERRRTLKIAPKIDGAKLELTLPVAANTQLPGETLAIAAWSLARSNGELRCSADAIVIKLPLAH
jgi:hypothetical protein